MKYPDQSVMTEVVPTSQVGQLSLGNELEENGDFHRGMSRWRLTRLSSLMEAGPPETWFSGKHCSCKAEEALVAAF